MPGTKRSEGAKKREVRPPLEAEVQALLGFMRRHDLADLEVEREGRRIRISRAMQPQVSPAPIQEGSLEQPVVARPGEVLALSPVVGRFYSARKAAEPPLASPGQQVKAGQELGVVEAMGVANEVRAPADGLVLEVLAADGQGVEYGQPLVRLLVGVDAQSP